MGDVDVRISASTCYFHSITYLVSVSQSHAFILFNLMHTSEFNFVQVQSYIQTLWKEIDPMETVLYNGAVEALITLLGAIAAFMAGFLNSKSFNRYEIWILTILMLVEGSLLLWAAYTTSLWCCYFSYVIFGMIYHFMITIARYDINSTSLSIYQHQIVFQLINHIHILDFLLSFSVRRLQKNYTKNALP